MTDEEMLKLFSEAFPNPTIWVGKRLKKRQVEVLNAIALEMEQRAFNWEEPHMVVQE